MVVVLEYPVLYGHRTIGAGDEFFFKFFTILICDLDSLIKCLLPHPLKVLYKIWLQLA